MTGSRKEYAGPARVTYRILAGLSLALVIGFGPATIRHWIDLHPSSLVDFTFLLLLGFGAARVVIESLSMVRCPRATIFQTDLLFFIAIVTCWDYPLRSPLFMVCSVGSGVLATLSYFGERYLIRSNLSYEAKITSETKQ
jgi:hypothetical protein